jgi:hypothetical protein
MRERYAHVEELAEAGVLRVALIDPGSVNIAPSALMACLWRSISPTRIPSPTCATWLTRANV